jgi:hypothetical protein
VADNGVLPVPEDYDQAVQGLANAASERFTPQIMLALLTILTLLPFYIVYRVVRQKRA